MVAQDSSINRLYQKANWLALITIYYNLLEGAVSVFFGFQDETLSLFGFGLDSFVEVISGIGVWHMIRRLRQSADGNPDRFEQRALKTTGTAFYLLTVKNMGIRDLARVLHHIYSGKPFANDAVISLDYADQVEIYGNRFYPDIEFDGDRFGYLPCRIQMAEQPLDLICGTP